LFAVAVLLAGSIAQITVSNWQGWLGAAVLVRLGVGLAQTILVTYVSEISPAQIRGFMIGSYQLMLAFGQLIVAIAAQLVTEKTPTVYKSLIAIEFLFTGVSDGILVVDRKLTMQSLICVIWLVPESHIYHARKGNEEAAKRSMLRLYGTAPNYDVVSYSRHPELTLL
jgi:MFS family permease